MQTDLESLIEQAFTLFIQRTTGLPVSFKMTGRCVLVTGGHRAAFVDDLPKTPEEKFKQRLKDQDPESLLMEAFAAYQDHGASGACRVLGLSGNKTGLPDGRLLIFEFILRKYITGDPWAAVEGITRLHSLQGAEATVKRLQRAALQEQIKLDIPTTWPR